MKATEHNTVAITGRVHPHGHRDKDTGPFDLRIGIKSQPEVLQKWNPKMVLLSVEQPHDQDNFTLIRVLYLQGGATKPPIVSGCTFHRARQSRRRGNEIQVQIKRRYCNSFPHPLPTCRYVGTCMYDVDGKFVVLSLQAVSLRKEPEPQKPKTILTPGDREYDLTLSDAQKSLSRIDGVGG